MAAGRVVFDGTPEQLTESEAKRLYGLESEPRTSVAATPANVHAEDPVLGFAAIA
jgi:ABC-type phosphate/phosphonate transport system ATPase subunit